MKKMNEVFFDENFVLGIHKPSLPSFTTKKELLVGKEPKGE